MMMMIYQYTTFRALYSNIYHLAVVYKLVHQRHQVRKRHHRCLHSNDFRQFNIVSRWWHFLTVKLSQKFRQAVFTADACAQNLPWDDGSSSSAGRRRSLFVCHVRQLLRNDCTWFS